MLNDMVLYGNSGISLVFGIHTKKKIEQTSRGSYLMKFTHSTIE